MSKLTPERREPFTAMTAYQFVFYTFYQLFEAVSLDKQSVWKAGLMVMALEVWICMIVLARLHFLDFAVRHGVVSLIVFIGLLLSWHHYAFDHNDRWKHYADQFKEYSKRDLIIGRILVAIIIIVSFTGVGLMGTAHKAP